MKEIFTQMGAFILFHTMWKNLVRRQWIDREGWQLKQNYYDNKQLVIGRGSPKLAELTGLSESHINKLLKKFNDVELIKFLGFYQPKKDSGANLYRLGTWRLNKKGEYREDLLLYKGGKTDE